MNYIYVAIFYPRLLILKVYRNKYLVNKAKKGGEKFDLSGV